MYEPDDSALVAQCLDGDRTAFETLVGRYEKPIFNIALRMTGRYEDAQDVAQTVFLKAFENLKSFKIEYRFFSWLYRSAVNESINLIHRRKPQEEVSETHPSPHPDPEEMLHATQTEKSIATALASLSPEYRSVIVLRHFEDLSYEEIAQTLGIPEKKVKSRLFDGRRLLCEALTKQGVSAYD